MAAAVVEAGADRQADIVGAAVRDATPRIAEAARVERPQDTRVGPVIVLVEAVLGVEADAGPWIVLLAVFALWSTLAAVLLFPVAVER